MSQHFIRKCVCGITLAQCRCPDPNKAVRIVEPCTHDNSVSQSDALERSEQHMALLAWKNGDITMIELKQYLDKAFAAEHARLLVSLRGKMPKDGEYARVDGKPGNRVEQAWDSGWNEATAQALAAIDAALDHLKGTSA